jgi:hypothetical protein
LQAPGIQLAINDIVKQYEIENPAKSVPALVNVYKLIAGLPNSLWRNYKLSELQTIIKEAAGIYMEASTQQQEVFPGSSLQVQLFLNQRSNASSVLEKGTLPGKDSIFGKTLLRNQNLTWDYSFKVSNTQAISQPYWLVQAKTEGMFVVNDQMLIGKAENDQYIRLKAVLASGKRLEDRDLQIFNDLMNGGRCFSNFLKNKKVISQNNYVNN